MRKTQEEQGREPRPATAGPSGGSPAVPAESVRSPDEPRGRKGSTDAEGAPEDLPRLPERTGGSGSCGAENPDRDRAHAGMEGAGGALGEAGESGAPPGGFVRECRSCNPLHRQSFHRTVHGTENPESTCRLPDQLPYSNARKTPPNAIVPPAGAASYPVSRSMFVASGTTAATPCPCSHVTPLPQTVRKSAEDLRADLGVPPRSGETDPRGTFPPVDIRCCCRGE